MNSQTRLLPYVAQENQIFFSLRGLGQTYIGKDMNQNQEDNSLNCAGEISTVDEIWDRNEQQQNLKRATTKRDEKVNCVQCMTQSYTKDTKREVLGEDEGFTPSSESLPRKKKQMRE